MKLSSIKHFYSARPRSPRIASRLLGLMMLFPVSLKVKAEDYRTLDSHFPMKPVTTPEEWEKRRTLVTNRVLLANGLLPMPAKTPLKAIRHGRVERDDFAVERVILESRPGHFVTGSLFLPLQIKGKIPAILSPHGHWNNGRFYDALTDGGGQAPIDKTIASGGEVSVTGARYPLQARCVHLARLGFAVLLYDMEGYADSVQLPHRTGPGPESGGLGGASADLWLQTPMALQTWNSIRALDFLAEQPEVDPAKIGVTGASGGGTQTMMITGCDPRVAAAFPVAMVSTGMQGGCVCENSHYLRINAGNIDIAALTAPRPLGVISADDWTKELEKDGAPELRGIYEMLGVAGHFEPSFFTQFPHGYNHPMRAKVYEFFWRHLKGQSGKPEQERDFAPLTKEELTVWSGSHAKPSGEATGKEHEARLLKEWQAQLEQEQKVLLQPTSEAEREKASHILDTAWSTMLGDTATHSEPVTSELTNKTEISGGWRLVTQITSPTPNRAFATTYWHPTTWNETVVVWLSPGGVADLEDSGAPKARWRPLMDNGYTLACPDLSWPADGIKAPPKEKEGWQASSLFHFGYNRPWLAERADDVIALLHLIRNHERKPRRILLAGRGAGAALAAVVAHRESALVDGLFVDTEGWRFQKLSSPWDPMFVPGAVKYGDLPGLLALQAPRKLAVGGESKESAAGWMAPWTLRGAEHEVIFDAKGGDEFLVKSILGR